MNFTISSEPVARTEPRQYPCLLSSTNTEHVVLFINRSEGMLLRENGFESASDWVAADSMGEWVPFTGTITVAK